VVYAGLTAAAYGQPDTLRTATDSLNPPVEIEASGNAAARFNPRKALLFSAIFPGAGQIYNKKYWKAPIVWGGFGVAITIVSSFHQQHIDFKNRLFDRLNGLPQAPGQLNEEQLRRLVDRTKRERDFFLIMSAIWYIMQMVDAHVDAHLKEFNLNPELKGRARIEPTFRQDALFGQTAGLALIIRL
jgi:hypothetical protein